MLKINVFINNCIDLGFWNIILIATVWILIHQGLNQMLSKIEKITGMEVQIYWYDIVIGLSFLWLFIYSIYNYKKIL